MGFAQALDLLRDAWIPKSVTVGGATVDAYGRVRRGAGDTYSGVTVDTTTALGLPPFWRARNLVCGVISTWTAQAWHSSGDKITNTVLDRLVPGEDQATTLFGIANDIVLDGNHLSILGPPAANGWPSMIVPQDPKRWQIAHIAGRRLYRRTTDNALFDETAVLHIAGPKASWELAGRGVITAHAEGLGLAIGLEQHSASYFDGGGMPSGVLEIDKESPGDDEVEEVLELWMRRFTGRRRRPAMLPRGVKFTPLSNDAEQQQLIEARNFSKGQVADMFNISAHWLDVANSSRPYASLEMEAKHLYSVSLLWLVKRIENQFTAALLPRPITCRLNPDVIMRPDTKGRYDIYAIATNTRDVHGRPLLSHEEIRDMENRRPLNPADYEPAQPPDPQSNTGGVTP